MPRTAKLSFSQILAALIAIGLIALLIQGVLGVSAGNEDEPGVTVAGYEIQTGTAARRTIQEVLGTTVPDTSRTQSGVTPGETVTATTTRGTQVQIQNNGDRNVDVQLAVIDDQGSLALAVRNSGDPTAPVTMVSIVFTEGTTQATVNVQGFNLVISLSSLATAGLRVAQDVGATQTAVVAQWNGFRWVDLPTVFDRENNTVSALVSQDDDGLYSVIIRDLATAVATESISAFVFRGPTGTAAAEAFAGTDASFFVFDAATQSFSRFIEGVPGNTLETLSQFDVVFVSGGGNVALDLTAAPFRTRTVLMLEGIDMVTYTGPSQNVGLVTAQLTGAWDVAWVWTNANGWQRFMRDPDLAFLNQVTTLEQGSIVAIRSISGLTWAME